MTSYCLDTSAFIGAWERTFPPDVVPSFWTRLDVLVQEGRVASPEEVKIELKKKDVVWSWATASRCLFPSTKRRRSP